MKKKAGTILIICGFALLSICVFFFGIALILFGPINTASRYSDIAAYERANGVVLAYSLFEDGEIFLSVDWEEDILADCFICPSNAKIALANGLQEEISQGTQITAVVCPHIFYDGGRCPIISLTSNGKEYISAEDALRNQAEWSRVRDENERRNFRTIMIPTLAAAGCGIVCGILGILLLQKSKRKTDKAIR